jgi:hypothetical protein
MVAGMRTNCTLVRTHENLVSRETVVLGSSEVADGRLSMIWGHRRLATSERRMDMNEMLGGRFRQC